MPMHVGGLQLFEKPEGAPRDYVAEALRADVRGRRDRAAVPQAAAPAASPRPVSGPGPRTTTSTSSTTSGTARCPSPAGSASCSTCARRLHSTRLARERPLWEAHLIEGLRDGRVALYTKMHHSLVDGISAMRLLQSVMTTDPDKRDMPPMWAARPSTKTEKAQRRGAEHSLAAVPLDAMRTALGITADAAGLPARPDQDAQARAAATRPRRSRSTRRARCSTPRSPAHAGSPPRAGRSSGCGRSARPAAPPSTTSCWRCARARSATYLIEHDALPGLGAGLDGAGRA